ncbi:hypothetical protein BLNAU_7509 [Blattamonas nauphoetae]|uniref:Uncharacterized protein n=1 Tax=Blattamonas nauphoetae TaxID=2049346 RepID=A0ABQ9Y1L3_9EUKA|nr:hypothetical protein BLNAU_7509 [Blattamonas nauphoetae]
MDCSAFLNWGEEDLESEDEKTIIFRSLVATVKIQPVLDASLEAKAVKFLKHVTPENDESADAFLGSFASSSDESLTNLIQSIAVLISSPNRAITTAAMKMLRSLIWTCSAKVRLAFVKADLFPQLISTLSPLSLSFTEAVDIHIYIMRSINWTVWLATPNGLRNFISYDLNEQQTVRETILKQVLIPSEKYICHLCMNRFTIIDGSQSKSFLELLATLLGICSDYQPIIEFVLHIPFFLTIPSCLTFFEDDLSIWSFLYLMMDLQQEWNNQREEVQWMWKAVTRILRIEGFEDVIEETLLSDLKGDIGGDVVAYLIDLNNMLGMNLSKQE